jgi:phosphohistidine phosphatase SixA
MRHAKHERGRVKGKPTEPAPLDKIASSVRELAQNSSMVWPSGSGVSDFSKASPDAVLTDQGRYETLVAAKRLKEFLPEWIETTAGDTTVPKLRLGGVLHYDHSEQTEAKETAKTLCDGYDFAAGETTSPLLGPMTKPSELVKANGESPLENAVKVRAGELATGDKNAVLFVGHQPAIGWLASALVGWPVPIVQSEIICIDLKNGGPTLSWSISPAGEVVEELREKIRSKMTLANLLGSFITAGIGVVLTMLSEGAKIQSLGVQAPIVFLAAFWLVMAVALYFRTMFSYDSLLMPIRFWAESASGSTDRPPWIVARPPSGAHWILYQNMIRIWQWQFIPATFLALGGLFMLWSGVALGAIEGLSHNENGWVTAGSRALSLSIPLLALFVLSWAKRKTIRRGVPGGWSRLWACPGLGPKFRYLCGPWLGSED